MARLLRSSWVLAAMTSLALVQCGGATFTLQPDGGGASGSSSGSSSGAGESGSSSGSGTGGTGASSGSADSGSVQGSGTSGSSGADTSGATSGSSAGASTGSSSGSGSGSRSGSSSGGSGASSGSSSGSAPCPASQPPPGPSCTDDGLECEYGSNPDLSCNSLATCEKSLWTYASMDPNCPINTCPLTYDRITPGGHCDPAGSSCGYPAGTCSCGSEGPPMISIDGGFGGPTWHCMAATAACPSPRPRIGTPCSGSQSCDYGACAGGIALTCTNGTWQESYVACPL
jgi:hypothetical protein